ncbi:methionine synthase reductase [Pancytospora philotis]|nr:methionine synthase reductase [Pancytospora philotis]
MIAAYVENFTLVRPSEYNEVTVTCIDEPAGAATPVFSAGGANAPQPIPIRITELEKLPCTWKAVYRVRLDATDSYGPGDAVGLVVPNSDELVDRLMRQARMHNRYCRIERTGMQPFVYEGYLRDFFKHRCDLTGLPKKIHLLSMARSSPRLREVEYLSSREGARDYLRIGAEWRTIPDILEHFDCRPSPEELLRNCEFIKPRYYSLTNANGQAHEVILGEMTRRTPEVVKYGHVSGYINRLHGASADTPGRCDPLFALFRANVLYNKMDTSCVVCFCTGTGIAPFLSLYNNRAPGQTLVLVYGYRNDEDDISRLYDIDCEIVRAKSADKRYVTDHCGAIEAYKDTCSVFVCGNMRMQRDVYARIKALYPAIIEGKRLYFDNWQ